MFFIPLDHPESAAAVIHILKKGQDCQSCPLGLACAKVNKFLCRSIARDLEAMLAKGVLPFQQNKGEAPLENPQQLVLELLYPEGLGERSVMPVTVDKTPPPHPEPPPGRHLIEGDLVGTEKKNAQLTKEYKERLAAARKRVEFLGLKVIKGGSK